MRRAVAPLLIWLGNTGVVLRRRFPAAVRLERAARGGRALVGDCPVCGADSTRFEHFTDNLRESGACAGCGASNRQRQMALMLRRVLGLPRRGMMRPPADCAIFSAEANGPLHAALAGHRLHVGSEYLGEAHAPGARVNGVRHEDLMRLSFPDASLDVVLTSDVLEHVPDAYRAHSEIHRVLRPGGCHIFTVPFREAATDDLRAVLRRGRPVLLAPGLYHGDPVRPEQGVLVWRIFGHEMLGRLGAMGFAASLHRLFVPRCGIIGPGAIVFVARRR